MSATIYLIRHATPDWGRTDIRYDIPPGPPLTAKGEAEAAALSDFLAAANVTRVYASPLERTLRTAHLATQPLGIPVQIDDTIAEWRHGESDADVLARCHATVEAALDESRRHGPIALVTHGGPIRLLLESFGVERAVIDHFRRQFDHDNPVPPAGIWQLATRADNILQTPTLVYTPQPHVPYTPSIVNV
jgi:broad specificity phosphatase PhoE